MKRWNNEFKSYFSKRDKKQEGKEQVEYEMMLLSDMQKTYSHASLNN